MRRDSGPRAEFARRRQKLVNAMVQLKWDVDSYNRNYNPGERIVIATDLTQDVAELEAADALRTKEGGRDV